MQWTTVILISFLSWAPVDWSEGPGGRRVPPSVSQPVTTTSRATTEWRERFCGGSVFVCHSE